MSIKKMSQAWQTDCKTHTQKLVLLALADNSNDEGLCWPSVSSIARKCNLTERSIIENIQQLCDVGYVQKHTSPGRVSNQYMVLQPCTAFRVGVGSTLNRVQGSTLNAVHPSPSTINVLIRKKRRKEADASLPAPGLDSQKLDPKAASPLPSAHQILIDSWCQAYESKFGGKYSFGGRDAAAVKALLAIETPEKLIRIAKAAWEKSGKGYWNCENQSASLIAFHAKLNQIRAELNAKHEIHQNPRNLGVGITPHEQTRQLLAKQQQLEAKRRAEHGNKQAS